VGHQGTILKTTNGGNSWALRNEGGDILSDVFALDENRWYISGAVGTILSSTNAGQDWRSFPSGTNNFLTTIYFADSITGYALGDLGTILKTTTGGLVKINALGIQEPLKFSLSQNYPNPFNPVTKIRFNIPLVLRREAQDVRLVIYDLLGKEIIVLVNGQLRAGSYEIAWNASGSGKCA
jgi:hypothetical protein